jgi:hypothetical protein
MPRGIHNRSQEQIKNQIKYFKCNNQKDTVKDIIDELQ